MVISIIFVDGKLITYQMDKFTPGRVIDTMESGRCQANVPETVRIDESQD